MVAIPVSSGTQAGITWHQPLGAMSVLEGQKPWTVSRLESQRSFIRAMSPADAAMFGLPNCTMLAERKFYITIHVRVAVLTIIVQMACVFLCWNPSQYRQSALPGPQRYDHSITTIRGFDMKLTTHTRWCQSMGWIQVCRHPQHAKLGHWRHPAHNRQQKLFRLLVLEIRYWNQPPKSLYFINVLTYDSHRRRVPPFISHCRLGEVRRFPSEWGAIRSLPRRKDVHFILCVLLWISAIQSRISHVQRQRWPSSEIQLEEVRPSIHCCQRKLWNRS